jgi:hypothetical protein
MPPEKLALSPGNVDMRSGLFKHDHTDLSIGGSGDAGLSLSRSYITQHPEERIRFAPIFGDAFTHNWDVRIAETRIQTVGDATPSDYDFQMSVMYDSLGTTFRSQNMSNTNDQNLTFALISKDSRATLTMTGAGNSTAVYTFTAADGTKVVFRPMLENACVGIGRCAMASMITKPDGTSYSLEYDSPVRLRSVTSNRGYAIVYEYVSGAVVTKACVINLSIMLKPANNICPAGVPSSTYGYSGTYLTSATDMGGGTYTFGNISNNGISITEPGASSPKVTVYGSYDGVTSQQFADGTSISYIWNRHDQEGDEANRLYIAGGSYTNAAGSTASVTYGLYYSQNTSEPSLFITPSPEVITDELGRVSRYNYCTPHPVTGACVVNPLLSATSPEGDRRDYTYDIYRNVTHVRSVAKPGSGLADRVEQKSFACTTIFSCAKPDSVTDARGGVTNYTYDPTHGGILTEAQPAGADGVRPVKRFSYVQRYAWLSNGAGGYNQAATPIWLLAAERSCRTTVTNGNTCNGGGGDEVVTTYDYGPDGVANTLLLRSTTVSADGASLRRCFGYDTRGNKISETTPRGGCQ